MIYLLEENKMTTLANLPTPTNYLFQTQGLQIARSQLPKHLLQHPEFPIIATLKHPPPHAHPQSQPPVQQEYNELVADLSQEEQELFRGKRGGGVLFEDVTRGRFKYVVGRGEREREGEREGQMGRVLGIGRDQVGEATQDQLEYFVTNWREFIKRAAHTNP